MAPFGIPLRISFSWAQFFPAGSWHLAPQLAVMVPGEISLVANFLASSVTTIPSQCLNAPKNFSCYTKRTASKLRRYIRQSSGITGAQSASLSARMATSSKFSKIWLGRTLHMTITFCGLAAQLLPGAHQQMYSSRP